MSKDDNQQPVDKEGQGSHHLPEELLGSIYRYHKLMCPFDNINLQDRLRQFEGVQHPELIAIRLKAVSETCEAWFECLEEVDQNDESTGSVDVQQEILLRQEAVMFAWVAAGIGFDGIWANIHPELMHFNDMLWIMGKTLEHIEHASGRFETRH